MHPTIIKIALLRCGQHHCGNCPYAKQNCRNLEEARRIYNSHIRPLEDALADAEALKGTMREAVEAVTSYAAAVSRLSNNLNNSLQQLKPVNKQL